MAPPIVQYDQLMCVQKLAEKRDIFKASSSSEELRRAWSEVNPLMARIRELVASVKSSLTDLVNAEKARRRVAKLGKDENREAEKINKASNLAELKIPFFERLVAHQSVHDVPSVHFKEMSKWTSVPETPVLIRDVPWSKEVLKAISQHKEDFDSFKPVFKNSKAKRTQGHGSRPVHDDDASHAMKANLVDSMFVPGVIKETPPADADAARKFIAEKQQQGSGHKKVCPACPNPIAHACLPAIFGMRSFLEIGGPEVGGLGCIRTTQEGSRNFACCHTSDLFEFLAQNGYAEGAITCQASYDYLKNSVAKQIEKFCSSGRKLWRCTVGAHETIFTPVGMFTMDEVAASDAYGHKMCVLAPTSKSVADLVHLRAEATRRKAHKEVEDINKVIAYLDLDEQAKIVADAALAAKSAQTQQNQHSKDVANDKSDKAGNAGKAAAKAPIESDSAAAPVSKVHQKHGGASSGSDAGTSHNSTEAAKVDAAADRAAATLEEVLEIPDRRIAAVVEIPEDQREMLQPDPGLASIASSDKPGEAQLAAAAADDSGSPEAGSAAAGEQSQLPGVGQGQHAGNPAQPHGEDAEPAAAGTTSAAGEDRNSEAAAAAATATKKIKQEKVDKDAEQFHQNIKRSFGLFFKSAITIDLDGDDEAGGRGDPAVAVGDLN